ncbi:hypothetical protein AMATHDRAFT_44254 [Amanita thiersii Skay4041]|uniref:DUF6533 domain-containing protein n=1 Tax=Amanita thiersii Skay4041 TaxID=703135 RepID=A0A2A9NBA3_9AGAR|nr:hypothetical protein AMATHDRAFT_44254 [Amanita thiersii Skay4041]
MDTPIPPEVQKALETGFAHLVANKYYVLASTVMLVYDHILTLEQERIYIWNQKKSIPSYLFLIFRYVTPIVSLINLIALHDPNWTGSTCSNWIWLPVAVGPIISAATGGFNDRDEAYPVILIMRVHAIYARNKFVLWITIPVYLAQLAVMGWSIPSGVPAQLPPGFVGCVPTEKPGTGRRLTALYVAALVFDATIFILTFGRAAYMRIMMTETVTLFKLIVRDGTLYFMVIFIVNLVNVFLLSLAPPDLSAINAPFASMITAVLVARLVLNLREAGKRVQVIHSSPGGQHYSVCPWVPNSRTRGPRLLRDRRKSFSRPTTSFYDTMGFDEFDVPLTDLDEATTDSATLVSRQTDD